MYCAHCGKELAEGANFCTACGSQASVAERLAIAEEMAPEETGGVSAALSSGRARSRLRMSPMILLVLALALTAGIAAAAIYVYNEIYLPSLQGGVDEERPPASGDASSEEMATVSGLGNQIDGWWRTVGQSHSSYHHIVDGVGYIYYSSAAAESAGSPSQWSNFSFSGKRAIVTMQHYAAGDVAAATEPCISVVFEGGQNFMLYESDPNLLVCINLDSSGYSGTSSLERTDEVSDQLLELARATEGAPAESEGQSGGQAGEYHFSSNHYEFDLPEYWRGRVVVVQDGDNTFIYAKKAYEAGYDLQLARMFLKQTEYLNIKGDISNHYIFSQEYEPGMAVFAWAHTPAFMVYYDFRNHEALSDDVLMRYFRNAPMSLIEDYVDLSTGGALSMDDLRKEQPDIAHLCCYAQGALSPLIRVRS